MVKTLFYIFKEIRPRQWIKNLTVFFAIFFTGKLFDPKLFQISLISFFSFCAASSCIYIINDLVDLEKDRLHPFKKNRPIAAGKVSPKLALLIALALGITGGVLASSISTSFLVIIVIFFLLHLTYSFYLKNVMLLDIMAISTGFLLRVFGGEVATGFHISIWLFLTVVSVSLFLAIGKRRSELTLLSGWEGTIPAKTRATLSHYSEKMLDVYLSMFANSAWITYAFYSFLERPPQFRQTFRTLIDVSDLYVLQDRKWLMLTVPFVIYGIMRYLQLIYEKNVGESPEKILLTDKPIIITGSILGVLLFLIVYVLGK